MAKQDHCCEHDHSQQNSVQSLQSSKSKDDVLTTFKVINMDCSDEIKAIKEALKIEGVIKVQANLMTSTIQILHTKTLSSLQLKKKIETTIVKVLDKDKNQIQNQNRNRIALVTISGGLLVGGLLFQWFQPNELIEKSLFFVSLIFGGSLVFPKALGSLRRQTLDMNVLMTVAVVGAVSIQEFSEAVAVVFLFSLSELLESLSVQRARNAIQELLKIAPQTVNQLQADGTTIKKM